MRTRASASPPRRAATRDETIPLTPRLVTARGILFQADCLDLLAALRPGSIHCVFADPPFNLAKDYRNGFDDALDDDRYLAWSRAWIDGCVRVLAPGGAFFIYVLPRWAFHFAAHLDARLTFRHWIALSMKGTFPRGRRLYPAHYALLYFTRGEPRVFNRVRLPVPTCRHCGGDVKDYGGHRKYLHPAGLNLTDFWEDTSPNRHRGTKARAGVNELKPMIPARAIELSTNPGDIVLDPFGGGGSTYQEAERLGRCWIGSELGSCAAIEARLLGAQASRLPRQRARPAAAAATSLPPHASLARVFRPRRRESIVRSSATNAPGAR